MKAVSGSLKAVHYLRIDHGEDLVGVLTGFLKERSIMAGSVSLTGAVSRLSLVCGPEQLTLPPVPHREVRDGGYELTGHGVIHTGADELHLHLHVTAGRGTEVLCGCLRGDTRVYLIVEAVIHEYTGFMLPERADPVCHLPLPLPEEI